MNNRSPSHFLLFQLPGYIVFFVFLFLMLTDTAAFYNKAAYGVYDPRLFLTSALSAAFLVIVSIVLKEMNK